MATGERKDPYKNHRFLVEIDGITQAGFREIGGISTSTDVIEYRVGNAPTYMSKLPGLTKHTNLVLKSGITDSMEMFNWRKQVEDGKIKDARKNMAVVVLDDEGQTAKRWEFSAAWPSKFEAPALNATANEVAIETVEIVYETVKQTK